MKKLVSTKNMLIKANIENYAVPAFNIHNLETFQTVVETAASLNSPVILASTPSTLNYAGGEYVVSIANVAAQKYDIPISIHLDHFEDVEEIKKYIDIGFTSVMIDASHKTFEENIKIVKQVVEYAHKFDVTVEAELGVLAGIEDDLVVNEKDTLFTDPNVAVEFVKKTNIDSLAISIGTSHGIYKGEPKLDYNRLKEIKSKVDIPLVLHGASNLPDDTLKKAINLGINKVNIATDLKIPFSDAIKKYFYDNPNANDPRKYMTPAKDAMKKIVQEKIKICNSFNRY